MYVCMMMPCIFDILRGWYLNGVEKGKKEKENQKSKRWYSCDGDKKTDDHVRCTFLKEEKNAQCAAPAPSSNLRQSHFQHESRKTLNGGIIMTTSSLVYFKNSKQTKKTKKKKKRQHAWLVSSVLDWSRFSDG